MRHVNVVLRQIHVCRPEREELALVEWHTQTHLVDDSFEQALLGFPVLPFAFDDQ
jgi:hypothetical protein